MQTCCKYLFIGCLVFRKKIPRTLKPHKASKSPKVKPQWWQNSMAQTVKEFTHQLAYEQLKKPERIPSATLEKHSTIQIQTYTPNLTKQNKSTIMENNSFAFDISYLSYPEERYEKTAISLSMVYDPINFLYGTKSFC